MEIKRSGPPTTHDLVMWRVPLTAPPSREWQLAFQTGEASPTVGTPKGVQFEATALTFRSGSDDVPAWVQSIDRWIAHANQAQASVDDERARTAARTQERSDARRQSVDEANEKFKNL
jgi:hypothetical protein